MTALDETLVPAALALISKVGVSATFHTSGGKAYDEATRTIAEVSGADVAATISPPQPYPTRDVDGDLIRVGDAVVYLAGSGLAFEPELHGKVTVYSQEWTIAAVNALYSGAQVAAWELQLRRQ